MSHIDKLRSALAALPRSHCLDQMASRAILELADRVAALEAEVRALRGTASTEMPPRDPLLSVPEDVAGQIWSNKASAAPKEEK